MKLAVQTSSGNYSVGLIREDGELFESNANGFPSLRRDLGGLASKVLESMGCDFSDITEIIADIGPGGLSSTRCGVSFANALAFSSKASLFGAPALELIMLEVRKVWQHPLLCMRPAPGGLAYWAMYVGVLPDAFGCSSPAEAIERFSSDCCSLAVAGSLDRFNIDKSVLKRIDVHDVNSAGLDCFQHATLRRASIRGSIQILEPITSMDTVRDDQT